MASHRPRIPAAVVVGLIVAIVLDTLVQIAWKRAVTDLPDTGGPVAVAASALTRPLFYAAMIGFVAQLGNWLFVLRRADLSFAQPVTALSYGTVLVIARWFLHESGSPTRFAGVALILLGVFFVTRTPAQTNSRGKDLP